MKEFLTEKELAALSGENHGGLRFELFQGAEKLKAITRLTLAGGIDSCNSFVNKLDVPDDTLFTLLIYTRYGSKRGQWSHTATLERCKDSLFNSLKREF